MRHGNNYILGLQKLGLDGSLLIKSYKLKNSMFRNISILFFNMIEARYALFDAISVLFIF